MESVIDLTSDSDEEKEERPRKKAKRVAEDNCSDGFEIVEAGKKGDLKKRISDTVDLADGEDFAIVGEKGAVSKSSCMASCFIYRTLHNIPR